MTEPLPEGDPFHNFDVKPAFHAYVPTKDLDAGIRIAARVAVDRARTAGHNPRKGIVTIHFDDAGVGARWEPKDKS